MHETFVIFLNSMIPKFNGSFTMDLTWFDNGSIRHILCPSMLKWCAMGFRWFILVSEIQPTTNDDLVCLKMLENGGWSDQMVIWDDLSGKYVRNAQPWNRHPNTVRAVISTSRHRNPRKKVTMWQCGTRGVLRWHRSPMFHAIPDPLLITLRAVISYMAGTCPLHGGLNGK